jgi:preprotein translocase subunit SecG
MIYVGVGLAALFFVGMIFYKNKSKDEPVKEDMEDEQEQTKEQK